MSKRAGALIIQSKACVVFTGAGMAADSGVDTFRSAGGLWSGVFGSMALLYGGTPLGWKLTPGYVWSQFIPMFLEPISRAVAHEGYFKLGELKELCFQDKPFNIVTMNVDGFHQASGADPAHVCEVHGTIRKFKCISCDAPIQIDDPVSTRSNPPRCAACGGYPRPDVTLFTEALPSREWERAMDAVNTLRPNDVMIVIGTSNTVYPAASIPQLARRRGAIIIDINPDENSQVQSDIQLCGGAKDMLVELVNEIKALQEQQRR